jgi:hypothetical protein
MCQISLRLYAVIRELQLGPIKSCHCAHLCETDREKNKHRPRNIEAALMVSPSARRVLFDPTTSIYRADALTCDRMQYVVRFCFISTLVGGRIVPFCLSSGGSGPFTLCCWMNANRSGPATKKEVTPRYSRRIKNPSNKLLYFLLSLHSQHFFET